MTDTNTPSPLKTINVEAQYLLRIGLRKGSVFSLLLQDVARQDIAATCIARQDIMSTNARHDVQLRYDERALDPQGQYQLQASIRDAGRLQFLGFLDVNLDETGPHRLVMDMVGAVTP